MRTFKARNNRELTVERIGEHIFFILAQGDCVLGSFEIEGEENIKHLLDFLTQHAPYELDATTTYETTYRGEDFRGRPISMKIMIESLQFHFIFKNSSTRSIATLADYEFKDLLNETRGNV